MCQKTISMCQGKGSLSHNNRAFAAKNIDSSRTADNITFVHQNLRDAYDILFSDAIERYNVRQKRNDRRIPTTFSTCSAVNRVQVLSPGQISKRVSMKT